MCSTSTEKQRPRKEVPPHRLAELAGAQGYWACSFCVSPWVNLCWLKFHQAPPPYAGPLYMSEIYLYLTSSGKSPLNPQ